MERHRQALRTLIAEDRYLTAEEKAQYAELERAYAGLDGGIPMPRARYGFPDPPAIADPPILPAESEKPSAFSTPSVSGPEQRDTAQLDIDAALREWNGDIGSKRAVVGICGNTPAIRIPPRFCWPSMETIFPPFP
jgi:hypothetical protein